MGKQLALDTLGVAVHIWQEGAMVKAGKPIPRWSLAIEPLNADILYGYTMTPRP